jgi:hypothetical protein
MEFRRQRLFALLGVPATLALVAFLEHGMYAIFASRPGSDEPDVMIAWLQVTLGLCVSAVLIALVVLVLHRPPGFLVATVYLAIGVYFTLSHPLILLTGSGVFYGIPFSRFIIGGHEMMQLVPPFFVVLGLAALVRSRAPRDPNA